MTDCLPAYIAISKCHPLVYNLHGWNKQGFKIDFLIAIDVKVNDTNTMLLCCSKESPEACDFVKVEMAFRKFVITTKVRL